MTPDHDQWSITAHHESSHATAYLHFGWRFGNIRIYQTDDGEVLGGVTAPAGKYDPMAKAICCLAGPVAEHKLTGISLEEQPGAYIDIEMAREALSRVHIEPRLDIDSILPFTTLMVESNWPTIQFLATQLLVYNELDYDDVVKLFR